MDQENREVQVIIDQRGFQVQVVIDLMEAQEDLLPLPIMCQENQLVQTWIICLAEYQPLLMTPEQKDIQAQVFMDQESHWAQVTGLVEDHLLQITIAQEGHQLLLTMDQENHIHPSIMKVQNMTNHHIVQVIMVQNHLFLAIMILKDHQVLTLTGPAGDLKVQIIMVLGDPDPQDIIGLTRDHIQERNIMKLKIKEAGMLEDMRPVITKGQGTLQMITKNQDTLWMRVADQNMIMKTRK